MTEQHGRFPAVRMRRSRTDDWSRRLVRETSLSVDDLIWPVFVQEQGGETPIATMPGVSRLGPDLLADRLSKARDIGIPAVALFPHVEDDKKTPGCEAAYDEDNLVCRSVRLIKQAVEGLGVICDVALDPYNSEGHDGLVHGGKILNDETIEILCKQTLAQARSGCDVTAPSDMMDGRVGALRAALDGEGFLEHKILSYAAKYASAFYGPFRDAVGSSGALKGDKKTYQMDPANSNEALREVALDLQEGADWVMVKPGMPYLDIVRRVKDAFGAPTFVYHVSGEYAMAKFAAQSGALDNDRIVLESLLAFKRAGADGILTYAAVEAAELLQRG